MTVWRPPPAPSHYLLALFPFLCFPLLIWLWGLMAARAAVVGFDPGVFLLGLAFALVLFLAGMLVYLAWCAFQLHYETTSTHLAIVCGATRRSVPLASITAVGAPGEPVEGRRAMIRWRGVPPYIPGFVVGEGMSVKLGTVLCFATVPVGSQVLVKTGSVTWGISPRDPLKFAADLDRLRAASDLPAEETSPVVALTGVAELGAPLWNSILVRTLLLTGIVANILFFEYISLVYGGLPERLALHWNAQAQVDRIGSPLELVRLPAFALAAWFASAVAAWWVLPRERVAGIFLLAGAVAAQFVFWAGALSIVLRAT